MAIATRARHHVDKSTRLAFVEMGAEVTTSAAVDGVDDLAVNSGHGMAVALEVLPCVALKDRLYGAHDCTPLIRRLIRMRLPSTSETCRWRASCRRRPQE